MTHHSSEYEEAHSCVCGFLILSHSSHQLHLVVSKSAGVWNQQGCGMKGMHCFMHSQSFAAIAVTVVLPLLLQWRHSLTIEA